jgi:hypothetical protein
MTTPKSQSTVDKKLSKKVLDSIFRTLIKDGTLTVDDFKDKNKLGKKLLAINKKTEWGIIVDHTDSLLTTAKMFSDKGDLNKAKLFYATFIEHELNRIVVELCRRKKIDKKSTNEIIKSTTMIGKLTWLPLLLDIPQVLDKHKNILLKLSDDRNAYVHYKHNALPDSIDEDDEQKSLNEMKNILQSIAYFKKYSSRILFHSKKTHVDKLLRKGQ